MGNSYLDPTCSWRYKAYLIFPFTYSNARGPFYCGRHKPPLKAKWKRKYSYSLLLFIFRVIFKRKGEKTGEFGGVCSQFTGEIHQMIICFSSENATARLRHLTEDEPQLASIHLGWPQPLQGSSWTNRPEGSTTLPSGPFKQNTISQPCWIIIIHLQAFAGSHDSHYTFECSIII